MLYDIDTTVYTAPTRFSKLTLIATLDQRDNLLAVLDTYHRDSIRNGTASKHPEPGCRARDRARGKQLWDQGVLSKRTIAQCFHVSQVTVTNWRTHPTGKRTRIPGLVNPDHAEYLRELLDMHRRGRPVPLASDSVAAVLLADPNPKMHTTLKVAANILGTTIDGYPRAGVGLTSEEEGALPLRPARLVPAPVVVRDLSKLPKVSDVEDRVPVTDISDQSAREAVELGSVPYKPEVTSDDTGDELLAELSDLDDIPDDLSDELDTSS